MSRVVTPAAPATGIQPIKVPLDKVAQRAYEKWVKGGMRHGRDVHDWLEAEAELRTEMSRTSIHASAPGRR